MQENNYRVISSKEHRQHCLELANILSVKLPKPDGKMGYEICGVVRGGIIPALYLQGDLGWLWSSPCGLGLLIPDNQLYSHRHKKDVKRIWSYKALCRNVDYHRNIIIVDDLLDSGSTITELLRLQPYFEGNGYERIFYCSVYSKNIYNHPEHIHAINVDPDSWLVFPHETDEVPDSIRGIMV